MSGANESGLDKIIYLFKFSRHIAANSLIVFIVSAVVKLQELFHNRYLILVLDFNFGQGNRYVKINTDLVKLQNICEVTAFQC